jgi:hypothetical protein
MEISPPILAAKMAASPGRELPVLPDDCGRATSSFADALTVGKSCHFNAIQQAGAPTLVAKKLISTRCDHVQGNLRSLMIMADEPLAAAAQREARQIDEKLFFEV